MLIETIFVTSSVLMVLIPILAWNLRRSRCTHSECWGGACDRQLMTLEEQKIDTLQKNMFAI
jgi:hypothetical protein